MHGSIILIEFCMLILTTVLSFPYILNLVMFNELVMASLCTFSNNALGMNVKLLALSSVSISFCSMFLPSMNNVFACSSNYAMVLPSVSYSQNCL